MSLAVEARRVGEIVVVTCRGRIVEGAEALALQQHFASLLPDSPFIVVDLSAIEFVDSSGLGLLVRFLNRARTARGDLKLCAVPARIGEVLRVTKLRTIFDVHESEAGAITAFYAGGAADGTPSRFASDILCVDGSPDVLAYLCELLRQAGYGVMPSGNLPDALVLLKASPPKAIVIGADLHGGQGTWTSDAFNALASALTVIELPRDFARRDAGDAGEQLITRVRSILGDRRAPSAATS